MWDVSDNTDAFLVQLESPDCECRHDHRRDGPCLLDDVGRSIGKSKSDQHGFQAFAHPEKKCRRNDTDRHGDDVRLAKALGKALQDFRQGMTRARYAEDVFQLAGGNQDPGGGDESCDHRVAEEICDCAKPEKPHQQQDRARKKRQRQGCGGIAGRPLCRHLTDRRCGHQRHDGDRAHGECVGCAEDRVK